MTRAEEIAAIEAAVRAGRCTRYPPGHSSEEPEQKINRLFNRPKADVAGRSNTKRSILKRIVTKANDKARRKAQQA